MTQPDVIEALAKQTIEPGPMPTAEFTPFFRDEVRDYEKVAKDFGLVAQ